ncbi:MAG: NADH-quinone oxidoreductase subunit NuoK [candidate division Zixibacteria bacterium]|nr:NADH-quinone oxidoreductase subunit NuoK [candidate division Zixibacteria bacterium]
MQLMHYLTLAAVLFCIGFFGIITRRNAVAVLMSLELMFNAVNINLVAFNRFTAPDDLVGQVFAVFVIVVAAAEATIGLAIVILIYRNWRGIDVDRVNLLKW